MIKTDLMNEPVFIIGSGRSGKTLLRLILDSTNDLAIAPETDIVWSVLKDLPEFAWNTLKSPFFIIRRPTFIDRELKDYGLDYNQFNNLIEQCSNRIGKSLTFKRYSK